MMTALKTLIFTVLVPGTVAMLIPYGIVSSAGVRGTIEIGSAHYCGLLLIPIGALIYLWRRARSQAQIRRVLRAVP